MHYEDKQQLDENILKVVIYTHTASWTTKIQYSVTSVRECSMFPPRKLAAICNDAAKTIGRLLDKQGMKDESWYLVTLKHVGSNNLGYKVVIKECVNVSEHADDSMRLH